MSSLTNPIFGPHSSFSLIVPGPGCVLGLTAHIVHTAHGAHGYRLQLQASSDHRVPMFPGSILFLLIKGYLDRISELLCSIDSQDNVSFNFLTLDFNLNSFE